MARLLGTKTHGQMVTLDFANLCSFCDLHASRWQLRRHHGWMDWGKFALIPLYFDRHGFPIPGNGTVESATLAWKRMKETDDSRLAWDELPDGSYLSTVWLGLDHNYVWGPPLIFETMRFCDDKDVDWIEGPDGTRRMTTGHKPHDFPDPVTGELVEQLRYTTEEEALAAHHEIVRRLRLREGH